MKTILKKKDKPKEKAVTAAGERGVAAYFRDPVDRSYILRLCVTLLTITVVAALLLGLTYYVTEPQITRRTREKTEEAMRSVLLAESYEELEFTPADGVTAISAASCPPQDSPHTAMRSGSMPNCFAWVRRKRTAHLLSCSCAGKGLVWARR